MATTVRPDQIDLLFHGSGGLILRESEEKKLIAWAGCSVLT